MRGGRGTPKVRHDVARTLDRERLTVRAAHSRSGIAAADFSRIRNADLGRFTLDRLMSILNRLGSRVGGSASAAGKACLDSRGSTHDSQAAEANHYAREFTGRLEAPTGAFCASSLFYAALSIVRSSAASSRTQVEANWRGSPVTESHWK